ncbi:unnamed protein product [Arctia plantaginis]|uniref:Major facilitator superfamily (MFS) profile domain-containing protein n=1 Tax=Arctia plantaginis TaxID=874455 RepID=A0A8S1AJV4_ARCPL|nr:unnamed protein product [Arctia plantaginis]
MGVGKFRQFHVAVACGFGSFLMSLINSWPSYTAEIYFSNTTTPLSAPMTKFEESLLGSLPSLGAMIGSLLPGLIVDRLGRRNGGVLLSLPVVISWAIVSVTTSMKMVLAARFLGGVSGGAFLVIAPIFISEVAEDSIRGTLASASMFLYCFGTLLSYVIGTFLTYHIIIWINVILSVTGTVLIALVTESPMFYLRQNREEDARFSIAKYRGVPVASVVVLDEISKLKQQVLPSVELVPISESQKSEKEAEEEKLKVEEEQEKPQSTSAFKLLFLQPASRWALTVVSIIISMQVFMGCVCVQVYAKTVFMQSDPSRADFYTIIFAFVLFSGTAVSGVITDKAGRRSLIIPSSALVFICMAGLGYLLHSNIAPPLVTVIMIFVYSFCFMLGAGTIPYVLLAEAFIPEVQSLASMIVIELVWFTNFIIIALFPYMVDMFGIHGSFYCFSVIGLANAIFSFFFVPETKGLSNAQIQDAFLSRKKN